MTIEFKVGKEYRTRKGEKVYLFGITRSGTNYFEEEDGSRFTTDPQGHWANKDSVSAKDIVSEWREPHVHECEIYASLLKNKSFAHDMFDFVFGTYVKGLSRKSKEGYRKFKVRVEEVLE